MTKSYKYRLYPNKTQQELIQKTFGCCRYVYNYFLDMKKRLYQEKGISLTYNQCSRELTKLKQELEWLKEPDKWALQKSLKDLDDAYQNFFKHHYNFPKFKSKKDNYKSYGTCYTNGNIKFLINKIQLPKLGKVKITDNMYPKGHILNATISQEPDGKYYCSLCCTDVDLELFTKTYQVVGIDVGIVDFAVLSDGTTISNPKFYEHFEKKLAKLQRKLSRETIGSSNWNKTRIKIAKLNKHIANQRNDFLQKLTTSIVKQYDVICIEDLDISEMKEQGNPTKIATRVRNKNIRDVSLYEFRRKLKYKCEWYGKDLRIIDHYYPSSQICHCCGKQNGRKSTDVRIWNCKYCGAILDRDLNAAINILNEGTK